MKSQDLNRWLSPNSLGTWIRPKGPGDAEAGNENTGRISTLYEWKDPGMECIPVTEEKNS